VRNSKIFLASFGLISSLSVLACGSKDEPPAAACDKFDYASYKGGAAGLTFAKDVYPITKVTCSNAKTCHGSNAAGPANNEPQLGPIVPTTDAAAMMTIRDAIVGKPALEAPALKYVTAGDPEHSWLMKKVEGVQACTGVECKKIPEAMTPCGEQMPNGGTPLSPGEQATIRDWIKGGAL